MFCNYSASAAPAGFTPNTAHLRFSAGIPRFVLIFALIPVFLRQEFDEDGCTKHFWGKECRIKTPAALRGR